MRTNTVLVFLGILIALPPAWFVYKHVQKLRHASSFENIEDLRNSMLERDEKDLKDDRSVSLRSIITPHPSNDIIFDLQPNLNLKFQGVPVRTNSCGMRNKEISVSKPPNTYRVALLGDSFAFGWGVEEDKIFASVMESKLNELTGGSPKVEVLNFGIPGYSTFQEVAKFKETGADFKPDAILVYFISNDFGLPFFLRDVQGEGSLLNAPVFARLSWSKTDPKIEKERQYLMSVLDPNKALDSLYEEATRLGARLFVAINPGKSYKDDFSRLWILRKNRNINTIKLTKSLDQLIALRKIPKETLKLPNDEHPSAIKHQMLGELLALSLSIFVE